MKHDEWSKPINDLHGNTIQFPVTLRKCRYCNCFFKRSVLPDMSFQHSSDATYGVDVCIACGKKEALKNES